MQHGQFLSCHILYSLSCLFYKKVYAKALTGLVSDEQYKKIYCYTFNHSLYVQFNAVHYLVQNNELDGSFN